MNRRDIVVGGIVVVLLLVLFNRLNSNQDIEPVTDAPKEDTNIEEQIENVLGRQIPDDADKITLQDGDYRAVVTREETEAGTEVSVLADLPEAENGESYEVVGLGQLQSAKGGYILETAVSDEVTDIEIKKGDETILQGSF